MAVEDADDRASFFDTDEFGTAATWNHVGTVATVNGIFSASATTMGGASGGVAMVETEARFVCPAAGVPAGAGQGDTLVIGGVEYVVRALLPAGALLAAELEKQA